MMRPLPTQISPKIETHHGVLMNVADQGVLIVGAAGSGKSSLALELLHHHHQLIADDCIEFQQQNSLIVGYCPPLLSGLLHQREIGLINVSKLFGGSAIASHCPLAYVVRLDPEFCPGAILQPESAHYTILGQTFPQLTLNPHNPAQLSHRLMTWIAMKPDNTAHNFCEQQQETMRGQTS